MTLLKRPRWAPHTIEIDAIAAPGPMESSCQRWRWAHCRKGYGWTWNGRRCVRAHNLYWIMQRGAIPRGMVLDHLCRVRDCINVDHLEVVTPTENIRRGAKAKLTAAQVAQVRDKVWAAKAAGKGTRPNPALAQIAKRYGIRYNHLWKIMVGEAWAD